MEGWHGLRLLTPAAPMTRRNMDKAAPYRGGFFRCGACVFSGFDIVLLRTRDMPLLYSQARRWTMNEYLILPLLRASGATITAGYLPRMTQPGLAVTSVLPTFLCPCLSVTMLVSRWPIPAWLPLSMKWPFFWLTRSSITEIKLWLIFFRNSHEGLLQGRTSLTTSKCSTTRSESMAIMATCRRPSSNGDTTKRSKVSRK